MKPILLFLLILSSIVGITRSQWTTFGGFNRTMKKAPIAIYIRPMTTEIENIGRQIAMIKTMMVRYHPIDRNKFIAESP